MKDYRRLKIFIIFWILSIIFIDGFLFRIQVQEPIKREILKREKERGIIYDRWGRELVFNISRKSLAINPSNINDKEKDLLIDKLSLCLNISKNNLIKKFNYKGNFVWIKRILSPREIKMLKDVISDNKVFFVNETFRTHPISIGTSPLLGIVGVDNQGLFGLEAILDPYLSEGKNIFLTIDKDLQYLCASYLKEGIEKYKAKGGIVGVLDVNSGEILSYAIIPDFDIKEESLADIIERLKDNYPLNYIYEPGSIFKILTTAIALEEKIIDPKWEIVCKGKEEVDNHIIHCTKEHGKVNLEKAIIDSCNIYFYHLSQKIGANLWYKYLNRFNLISPISGDIIISLKDYLCPNLYESKFTLGTIGFGQGIALSPLKILWSFSAVANDGWINELHLIKKIEDEKGIIIFKNEPKKLYQAISSDTSKKILSYLFGVVNKGTANNLNIKGYMIAGKTGTPEVAKNNGYNDIYNHFFLGFLFLNDKTYAIIVMLEEPKIGKYARETVVPIFREIVKKLILYGMRE